MSIERWDPVRSGGPSPRALGRSRSSHPERAPSPNSGRGSGLVTPAVSGAYDEVGVAGGCEAGPRCAPAAPRPSPWCSQARTGPSPNNGRGTGLVAPSGLRCMRRRRCGRRTQGQFGATPAGLAPPPETSNARADFVSLSPRSQPRGDHCGRHAFPTGAINLQRRRAGENRFPESPSALVRDRPSRLERRPGQRGGSVRKR